MARHGSESYFVLGEGLLAESVGGRDAGPDPTPAFRFSRMGPDGRGRQLRESARRALGDAMVSAPRTASRVPAGFTYLGQFIDHDLTFDRTRVMLGERISPSRLLQGRSPSLDLDSLYGAGPEDPRSARLYEADGVHLRMGRTLAAEGIGAKDGFDLPRGRGDSAAKRRKAVIGDPRNDENLAVAQTHLAFIRFHNRVIDDIPASVAASRRFARARELVTKHYQWMIRTDYLPRVCARAVLDDVFRRGRKVFEIGAVPSAVPTMPIEFSVAAFRLGHSMIRADYNWNRVFDDGAATLGLLFSFSAGSGRLGGKSRLLSTWIADFRRLYDFAEAGRPDLVVRAEKFNHAMRIATSLVDPLRRLPRFPAAEANLAFRNLTRAQMVRLATGQQMATFMKGKGVSLTRLRRRQIEAGDDGAELDRLTGPQRAALLENTPLWFYVLREAELAGGRLDGVGARIVAETFHRAMQGSQASIIRDRTWRPTLGPDRKTFRMVDLLLYAFKGRKSLLAPLG